MLTDPSQLYAVARYRMRDDQRAAARARAVRRRAADEVCETCGQQKPRRAPVRRRLAVTP